MKLEKPIPLQLSVMFECQTESLLHHYSSRLSFRIIKFQFIQNWVKWLTHH